MKTRLLIVIIVIIIVVVLGVVLAVRQQKNNVVTDTGIRTGTETGTGTTGTGSTANIDDILNSIGAVGNNDNSLFAGQDGGVSGMNAEINAINNASNSYDENQL